MQLRRTLTLTLSLFERERGTFGGNRVRVTEHRSEKGALCLSSPRSERGEDQGEGRFGLHDYG